ncbi:MAG TPA: TonB-dependent receptor [Thermoanaerobaculia bacterium]|nr:TonB-dependent receptor [Thermoanaerobaculia bacterium]
MKRRAGRGAAPAQAAKGLERCPPATSLARVRRSASARVLAAVWLAAAALTLAAALARPAHAQGAAPASGVAPPAPAPPTAGGIAGAESETAGAAENSPEAAAADPEPGPGGAKFYETATVSARPLASATATVTVLTRQEIAESGVRTVAELLRFVPGLDVTTNGTRGGLSTVQMRGGKDSFSLLLLDGVPVNDPTYQVGDVFDLEGLPAAAVERIEIVRGPLSSIYGSTGLAGAINLITRQGRPGLPSAELEVGAGNAALRQLHGTLSGGLGRGGYAVGLGWEEESRRIARDSFRELDSCGSLNQPLGSAARLRLNGRYALWHGDDYPDSSGGPLLGSGRLRRSEHRETGLGGELSADSAAHPSKWTLSLYRHDLDRTSPAVGFLVPASDQTTAYSQLRAGGAVTLYQGERLHWSGGLDAERQDGENRSLLHLPPRQGGELHGDYTVGRTLLGAYSELLWAGERSTVELGARLDRPRGAGTRGGGGRQWSPRAGWSGQPGGGATRLHASAGRAFKLPSFFALASPRALGGNPGLRPETSFGADAGAEQTFAAARFTAGATLFYNRFRDLIDFDFQRFLHVNRSIVEAHGAELALTWRPAAPLSAAVNLTWQEVKDLRSHAPLLHRPRWVGGGRVDWRPLERLSLRLDAQAVSRSFDQELAVPGRDTVAGYPVIGFAAGWRLGSAAGAGWKLRGRVDNLADRHYQTLIGFPGPRRSLLVTLAYGGA